MEILIILCLVLSFIGVIIMEKGYNQWDAKKACIGRWFTYPPAAIGLVLSVIMITIDYGIKEGIIASAIIILIISVSVTIIIKKSKEGQ